MKNVFITGGSGYSGKYLSEYLSKKKINVLSSFYKKKIFKKNYIKSNLLKEINLNIKCDWIVHTASHHKIKDFKNNPKLKLKNNIKMVKNLINFAKKKKIKNFIFYSTFDLNYPKKNEKKITYINSKIECEKLLISAKKKGFFKKLFILRLPAIIGKNASSTFIKNTLKKIIKNKKIHLWNHNEKFDKIINIHDLNNLILYLLNLKTSKRLIFIDCLSSKSLKLINLVKLLIKKNRSKSEIMLSNKNNNNIPKLNKKINYKFFSTKKAVLVFMNDILS